MNFSISIPSVNKIVSKLNQISAEKRQAAYEVLADGVLAIHGDAIKSIQSQSSNGGKQVRYNPKRTVTVSKPGQPPNSDTGILVKSIAFDVDKTNLKGKVGTNLMYGVWLEFGNERMPARPWLRPAYFRHVKEIQVNMAKALKTK